MVRADRNMSLWVLIVFLLIFAFRILHCVVACHVIVPAASAIALCASAIIPVFGKFYVVVWA